MIRLALSFTRGSPDEVRSRVKVSILCFWSIEFYSRWVLSKFGFLFRPLFFRLGNLKRGHSKFAVTQ